MCFLSVEVLSQSTPKIFIENIKRNAPEDVLTYWEQYSSMQDIRDVNTLYVKIGNLLPSGRLKTMNDIAYVKCVVELSLFDKSFELLRKLKREVQKEDDYLKGSYYLVFARLQFRVGRKKEAIASNVKAINFLKKAQKGNDLKNAYLNLGYLYSDENDFLSMQNYALAKKLEQKGILKFYVLLRTNLALRYLIHNDTKTALAYCNEAQKYLKETKNRNYLDQFRVLIIMASICELDKNFVKEDEYLKKAKELCYAHGMNMNLTSIIYSESYNYAQKNDFKNAYYSLKEMDSIKKILGLNQISENLAVYDLEDKIAIAKKEKKRISDRLTAKRKQQQILLLILLLVLVVLSVITTLFLKIRKKNEVLLTQNLALAKTEVSRTKPESSDKNINVELIIELEKLIFDKELFKNSSLTIDKLAKKLNTNRTYLSEAINSNYKTNYSSWINEVRINAARKMLALEEFDHFSIEGIAKMVGYISISSFNSSFKKINGLTPSQFKNMRVNADKFI